MGVVVIPARISRLIGSDVGTDSPVSLFAMARAVLKACSSAGQVVAAVVV